MPRIITSALVDNLDCLPPISMKPETSSGQDSNDHVIECQELSLTEENHTAFVSR